MNAPVPFRELAGALVVDPTERGGRGGSHLRHHRVDQPDAGRSSERSSRRTSPARRSWRCGRSVTFVINGLSWPATERLTYRRGEAVRWRVINLSSQTHPMHLHGFYFTVMRAGNGRPDEPVAGGAGPAGRDARCSRPAAR